MLVSVKEKIDHPYCFLLFLNDLVDFIARGYDGLADITNTAHLVFDNDDAEVYL